MHNNFRPTKRYIYVLHPKGRMGIMKELLKCGKKTVFTIPTRVRQQVAPPV